MPGLAKLVRDPAAGADVVFEGATLEVPELQRDKYTGTAEVRTHPIRKEGSARRALCAVTLEHRIGGVPLSETSLIVAASARHCTEAFGGAHALIDRLEAEVPIWRQEATADHVRRVEGVLPPVSPI